MAELVGDDRGGGVADVQPAAGRAGAADLGQRVGAAGRGAAAGRAAGACRDRRTKPTVGGDLVPQRGGSAQPAVGAHPVDGRGDADPRRRRRSARPRSRRPGRRPGRPAGRRWCRRARRRRAATMTTVTWLVRRPVGHRRRRGRLATTVASRTGARAGRGVPGRPRRSPTRRRPSTSTVVEPAGTPATSSVGTRTASPSAVCDPADCGRRPRPRPSSRRAGLGPRLHELADDGRRPPARRPAAATAGSAAADGGDRRGHRERAQQAATGRGRYRTEGIHLCIGGARARRHRRAEVERNVRHIRRRGARPSRRPGPRLQASSSAPISRRPASVIEPDSDG